MRHERTRREDGFTLIELLIVVAIIGVLASIVTAQLLRARAAANESSTISVLRSIVTAQVSYSQSCAANTFATSLTALGSAGPGQPSYLSPDLTSAAVISKAGYLITLTAGVGANAGAPDCNGVATTDRFYASGTPVTFNLSGGRAFAVTTAGTIWQTVAAAPPAEPFGAPATPLN
jgi:prepilin-type N-terminal cleavage/methylation domain-containing protein